VRRRWIVSVALLLSGCAYPWGSGGDPQTASLTREVPPSSALVMPPPGGPAVIAVLERRYVNAIAQTIVIANDSPSSGQNEIDAAFYGPASRSGVAGGDRLARDHATMHDIETDMLAAFPGVNMRVSRYFVQNGYGPFGYAIGRPAAGGLCLYAWQLIEPKRNQFGEPVGGHGAIRLRVRLCRGRTTEEQLLRFMYGLTVSGYYLPYAWNPYGTPPPPPESVGAVGSPTLPVPTGENPYYVDTRADRREGRVLPAAPVVRRAPAGPSAYPEAGISTTASPIEPPLGMPSALPGAAPAPAAAGAAPAAPAAPARGPVAPQAVRPAVPGAPPPTVPAQRTGPIAVPPPTTRRVPATGAAPVAPVAPAAPSVTGRPAGATVPPPPGAPAAAPAARSSAPIVPRPTLGPDAGSGAPRASPAGAPGIVVPPPPAN
jgi:hypothetical protein